MAAASQEGNSVIPSCTRDKQWVSGDDPGELSTTNVKNLGGFGRAFEHKRERVWGGSPPTPFFP